MNSTIIMSDKWINRFVDMTNLVATWSKDPNRQIGCVVVGKDRHVLAMGYNGFPKGMKDSEKHLEDKGQKRLRMIHAELNAILNSTADLKGATLFVSRFPCQICAGIILQAGIANVVVPEPDLDHKHWGVGWKVALEIVEQHMGIKYVKGYSGD